jgi:hypothetical protein
MLTLNLRELFVRLLLAASLAACIVWLALCLLLTPVLLCVRRVQRKAAA